MKHGYGDSVAKAICNVLCEDVPFLRAIFFVEPSRRVNPPKLGPKPEDLDWGLSKEAGGAREVLWQEGQSPPGRQVAIRRPIFVLRKAVKFKDL